MKRLQFSNSPIAFAIQSPSTISTLHAFSISTALSCKNKDSDGMLCSLLTPPKSEDTYTNIFAHCTVAFNGSFTPQSSRHVLIQIYLVADNRKKGTAGNVRTAESL